MSLLVLRQHRKLWRLTGILLSCALLSGIFLPMTVAVGAEPILVKIVIIANSESYFPSLVSAYGKLVNQGYPLELKIFNGAGLVNNTEAERLRKELRDARVVLLEMIGLDTIKVLRPFLTELPADVKILSTKSSEFPDLPRIDAGEDAVLKAYFDQGGVENMRRLLLYLASRHGGLATGEELLPVPLPDRFIYHPEADQTFNDRKDYLNWYRDAGKLKPRAPWIGIITYDSFYKNGDIDIYTALLRELEAQGANVILSFAKDRVEAVRDFFMEDGQGRIDLLIAATGFNFVFGKPEEGVKLFRELNVPVMAPVYARNLEQWKQDPAGLAGDVYWQIAYPELDGRVEPVMLGGTQAVGVDAATGVEIVKKVPIPDRVQRLARRAMNWAMLRHKPNGDKRVAIIYYNYSGGKDSISASYLNVPESIAAILQALKKDGYRVEGNFPGKDLLKIMLTYGRNVGSWAPGELETMVQAGAMTVPVEDYLRWFRELPRSLQEAVEREWGPAPGRVMVYQGQLVIPGLMLGNVFIGPQPMRGWGDDPQKITHSPTLPPTHQYLAFYFWLQHDFKADAVIHLGTHGTLEWLPGRSVGLGADDWPDVVLGDLPNIYPYIVNNPGEGTQAKRRGYAVIIDHLTPPMVKPELYGDLAALQEMLNNYEVEAAKGNTRRLAAMQKEILEKITANNLDQVLHLDLARDSFERVVQEVDSYLAEMVAELMPYGLHTFGRPPEEELLERMASAMVAYDPATRSGSEANYQQKLTLSTREMDNLLRALRGEYIPPGLGRDPVRIPDTLPTGVNFYSFDPRMVPDKAAWETGKKAADQLLAQYLAEHGRYPERVGVVLWAIETMRTQGETIAMILRLIGAEPKWDKNGRVTGIDFTPISQLGRPRVDVLVTISGLFRDTFAYMVELLDDALAQVARLEEQPEDNMVKKHFQEDLQVYREEGYSEKEAEVLAAARIFGDPPGAYGTGVSEMVEATSFWDKQEDLARTYLARMRYAYGKRVYGQEAESAFRRVLSNTEVITQVRDSLWGVLDNDDVYQYLGGLNLAARQVSGREVDVYITNTRQARDPQVQSFNRFLGTELRTRVLNPIWIEGMLQEGYSGSTTISKHVGHLFGVDATLDAVDNWSWRQVMETIVLDPEVRDRLSPYAVQAIAGWGLEAARRQMWQADQETLSQLANTYVQSVLEYGVVCCHHTCANIVFNEWLASFATLPGQDLARFGELFREATNQDLHLKQISAIVAEPKATPQSPRIHPVTTKKPGSSSLIARREDNSSGRVQEAGEAAKATKEKPMQDRPRAYEIYSTEQGEAPGTGSSGVTFWAILGALLLGAVIAAGYFGVGKKNRPLS
ncbi:cobaltochelatase subunit CobN [Calderihabitans maritimus]|uniref:Magnesium chelatase n=1 Tax=Calderihabitans maritimus TaxID=1246530 RepID=A0A1Z5HSJ2_9FIRM|nr:cobaltochelatase subunit CobN [Calderihabitans maritimus]GAW92496.1 magnesium chelatase [Calderihabitans maritimus]